MGKRIAFNSTLPRDLVERWRSFCAAERLELSTATEFALKDYMNRTEMAELVAKGEKKASKQ